MFDKLKKTFGRGPTMADMLQKEILENELNVYHAQKEIEYHEASKALATVRINRARDALARLKGVTVAQR